MPGPGRYQRLVLQLFCKRVKRSVKDSYVRLTLHTNRVPKLIQRMVAGYQAFFNWGAANDGHVGPRGTSLIVSSPATG